MFSSLPKPCSHICYPGSFFPTLSRQDSAITNCFLHNQSYRVSNVSSIALHELNAIDMQHDQFNTGCS